jgi:hypothetical protein
MRDILLIIRKFGIYGRGGDEGTIEGIECMKTVFGKTDIGF